MKCVQSLFDGVHAHTAHAGRLLFCRILKEQRKDVNQFTDPLKNRGKLLVARSILIKMIVNVTPKKTHAHIDLAISRIHAFII